MVYDTAKFLSGDPIDPKKKATDIPSSAWYPTIRDFKGKIVPAKSLVVIYFGDLDDKTNVVKPIFLWKIRELKKPSLKDHNGDGIPEINTTDEIKAFLKVLNVQAARAAPGGISTLILPADTAWNAADHAAGPLPDIGPAPVASDAVVAAARRLRKGKKTALLLRGTALQGAGLEAAGRVQAKTGARLLCDTFAPDAELGAGRVPVERIPSFAEQIVAFLAGLEQIINNIVGVVCNGIFPAQAAHVVFAAGPHGVISW